MKESSTGTENTCSPPPTEVQPSPNKSTDGSSSGSSPVKKNSPTGRKSIRPKMNRSAGTGTKVDQSGGGFEVDFAFDPNEDPFKTKSKLMGSSPPRTNDLSGSPKSLTLPDANSTVCAVKRHFYFLCK